MITNNYIDKSAFTPTTLGGTEHHFKFRRQRQERHRSLTVCWLNLVNVYGNAKHSLISFALKHYNTPLFCRMVEAHISPPKAALAHDLCHSFPWSLEDDPLSCADSPASCHYWVDIVAWWLSWSGIKEDTKVR